MNCPEKAGYCGTDGSRRPVTRKGLVEGVVVSDIPLDTWCTQTMVRRDLVSSSKIIEGEATTVKCVHGDNVLHPIADVAVEVEGLELTIRAAISDSLPMSVLLGTDVQELGQLLHGKPVSIHTEGTGRALVTTRAEARRRGKLRAQSESGAGTSYLEERPREQQEDRANVMVTEAWEMEAWVERAYPASKRYLGGEASMLMVQLTRHRKVGIGKLVATSPTISLRSQF